MARGAAVEPTQRRQRRRVARRDARGRGNGCTATGWAMRWCAVARATGGDASARWRWQHDNHGDATFVRRTRMTRWYGGAGLKGDATGDDDGAAAARGSARHGRRRHERRGARGCYS
uniref:Uncharacterized protein n=1 Tax=Oryza sativa subsp. japonica TaxID=39947 RepID=Q2QTB1_ORYSJ|nr:hypothetical protein LOC_Os12g20260 [Oryza sativa Japonica Group]